MLTSPYSPFALSFQQVQEGLLEETLLLPAAVAYRGEEKPTG